MRQWLMGAVAAMFLVAMPAYARLKTASMVVDADTGEVLEASNVDARIPPASLTKMMTLYLLFDDIEAGKVHLSDRMPVSRKAAHQQPSIIGLTPGRTLRVEDAIYAMVVKSANDAAMATGEFLGGGSSEVFAERMNRKARELGMTRTTFKNPNGLPNSQQKSTARDLATLARALLHHHAREYHYFATREFTYEGQVIRGHNHLLDWYEGADGIKTGFVDASGFNLVTSAKRDGRRLVGVVLGGQTAAARDHEMGRLLDAGFARAPGSSGIELAELPVQEEVDEPAPRSARSARSRARSRRAKVQLAAARRREAASAGDTDDDQEEWAIQVGASSQQTRALQLAQVALRKIGKYGEDGEAKAIPSRKSHRHHAIYQSRIVGLSKSQAYNACRSLEKHHHPCRAINLG